MITTRSMYRIKNFILDSGRWGVASEIAALAVFAVGLWEHAHDKPLPGFIFVCVSIPLFWLGAYLAWLKKQEKVERLELERETPKLFLRYEETHDTSFDNSGFFVQVEGEKKAFDVNINSEPVVGQSHKRIAMLWEVPKSPIGKCPAPIHAQCVRYEGETPYPFGGISNRQIHRFFEEKKDLPNEFQVTLIYKDVDGRKCPPRKFKITSDRNYRGHFEIGCIPLEP